jgi:hypothetical protein
MVTVIDDWLERVSDILLGKTDDEIHEIAVGTGTGNEGSNASSLANEVYRSNKQNSNCWFEETGSTGQFRAHLEVTAGGGTANVSVPGENDITEIAVFSKSGQMVVIDEFASPVTIPTGHTEEFIFDGDYT